MSSEQDLGITESKQHNTGEWYAEVVRKAGLVNYGPDGMSGFIVTRPRGYALWEAIQSELDGKFKATGVQNAYFPMFIPESYLEREKEIVEGFDPEVAWVTHGGHDELEERLAVRPTSESIIAPYMAQWVRSHRDLPLRVNQWCSVVRWEATETKPFFRTKEFLFADEDEATQPAHTTSWGLSWRALGALIMTHSDDQGLVLPPTIAPEQVVVVPIWQEDTKDEVLAYADSVADELSEAGVRVELDDRDGRNPGFKFNEWELKGVPVRIEVGPHEVEDDEITIVHRPDGETTTADREGIAETITEQFDEVYAKLYAAAEETLEDSVREADSREEILGTLGRHGGYVTAPWCGDEDCEEPIKEAIAGEIVMCPFDDEEPIGDEASADSDVTCAICDEPATQTAYFAKNY